MNILFISPNSPFESIGGIERYISNLINYYKNKANGNVCIIIPTLSESSIKKDGNVTIYFDTNLSIPRHAARRQKEIVTKARLFAGLVETIIKEQHIDIICAENFMFGPPAIYSLLLNMIAMIKNIPLILRLHSFAATELQRELINQLMWNKISCVSKSVAGDCFQKGTDINQLSTDYLGVDASEFSIHKNSNFNLREKLGLSADKKIILTATRIVRGATNILAEKGLINSIQAFSKLSPRYQNLHLVIAVGKPTDSLKEEFAIAREMLLGYIKLHSIEKTTSIEMFQLHEMPDVYKGSDVFVLPSENETFGQVFIEAMSCGLPVIGTKVGGIPEIISDSYNGYLIRPNDSSILAQKIEKLINDNKTRDKFKNAGIKTVQSNFTSEKQFASFHKMLESIVTTEH